MRYFSKENLVKFGYPKRHYVSQLAFAFFENPHKLHYLSDFEKKVKAMRKVKAAETILTLGCITRVNEDGQNPNKSKSVNPAESLS